MTEFHLDSSTVRIWKRAGAWSVAVDGVAVDGRHLSEARAAGAALLHVLFGRAPASGAATQVAPTPRRRLLARKRGVARGKVPVR